MHFDLTISLGTVIGVGTILLALWRLERKYGDHLIEHEILLNWYCRQNGLRMDEIPTRSSK